MTTTQHTNFDQKVICNFNHFVNEAILLLYGLEHYALSVIPLQHKAVLFAVFCQAGSPRRIHLS